MIWGVGGVGVVGVVGTGRGCTPGCTGIPDTTYTIERRCTRCMGHIQAIQSIQPLCMQCNLCTESMTGSMQQLAEWSYAILPLVLVPGNSN